MIKIKRAYEPSDASDGYRVLVDRLWPRGLTKDSAHIDEWLKDIAPSDELRKWFGHEDAKWSEFQKKYHAELRGNKQAISRLRDIVRDHTAVTLVYAAHNEQHNNAAVLEGMLRRSRTTGGRRAA